MIPMKQTPLSQLATVSAGQAAPKDDEFSDHGIPFVRAGSLDSLLSGKSESDLELVSDETAKLRRLKTYPKGTILFAKSGMSATKDRIYVLQNPAYVVSHLATLIPNGDAHADYLRLALKRFPPSVLIKDPAYPAISLGDIQNYQIPVPEQLGDQIRIAHLLSEVEGLIAQRKQHLRQLDDLLKSVFLEMFGDPVGNEKGWDLGTSSVYAEMVTVGVVVKPASYYVESGVVALRSLNIKPNHIDLNDLVYFSQESNDGILSKSRLKADDVVIVRTGKTGTAAVVPVCLDGANCIDLIIVRAKRETMHPQYLTCLLNSERGMALVASREVGGIQKHFNVGALNKIPFPLPPIELQNKFAAIVEKIESIKSLYQQSLTDLEVLYGALSQQAFKGELNLSRVLLPTLPAEGEQSMVIDTLPPPVTTTAIHLPETDLLPIAIENRERLKELLHHWLEAYCDQLGTTPFSIERFMVAAQTRLAELHPDTEFELGGNDYENIKTWVFDSLGSGKLTQGYDDESNRVQLKTTQA